MSAFTASRLRQLVRARPAAAPPGRPGPAGERCELCSEPLPESHRHLLDIPADEIRCACRACSLLFDRQAAGGGHYRLLPDRRMRLDGLHLDDLVWAALGIPVDLAFFVRGSADGKVLARYPSPLGTLRADIDRRAWASVERDNPALATMEEDVEALLVDRTGGALRSWLLPLDDCYRLSAVVRTHWQGLSGGDEVRRRIEDFFTQLPEEKK
ncbi:DUF5947 family protein [Streptomyces sannanensis]|uniref:DUF5947 family protein n=1 Tax=Streptomyces sannanensis TaxID=285536 RepID=A0ABP6SL05_9ACTN